MPFPPKAMAPARPTAGAPILKKKPKLRPKKGVLKRSAKALLFSPKGVQFKPSKVAPA